MTDAPRYVAQLIERLLSDADDPEIHAADMRGMMAAVSVELVDGSMVIVDVNPADW